MTPNSLSDRTFIQATQAWLKTVIIEFNICPFAKREQERGSIYYSVNFDSGLEQCLEHLLLECDRLDSDPSIETTLVIYAQTFAEFDDYLDFADIANELMHEQGYEGIYQLASFHPNYLFQDSEESDAANYTNRSPYPMLHLIREESIEQALKHYPDPEDIPQRNAELTRTMGLDKMKALLAACYKN